MRTAPLWHSNTVKGPIHPNEGASRRDAVASPTAQPFLTAPPTDKVRTCGPIMCHLDRGTGMSVLAPPEDRPRLPAGGRPGPGPACRPGAGNDPRPRHRSGLEAGHCAATRRRVGERYTPWPCQRHTVRSCPTHFRRHKCRPGLCWWTGARLTGAASRASCGARSFCGITTSTRAGTPVS
jgi:hypothetical protein